MQLVKLSGTFVNVGDIVNLTIPEPSQEVALRLYDEGLEIAIRVLVDNTQQTSNVVRSFQLIADAAPGSADLPANFIKYIGSLLVAGVECHIIEIAAALP